MMKVKNTIILLIVAITLISCSPSFISDGGINRYIYPYLEFTFVPDGVVASVLSGVRVKSLDIPSYIHGQKGAIPVVAFSGFQNPDDAKNLNYLTIGAETDIDRDFFDSAINIASIERKNIEKGAKWELPSSMPKRKGYHFLGWFCGKDKINDGDAIKEGQNIIVPVYEKHKIAYLYNNDEHWLECIVCHERFGEVEAHHLVEQGGNTYCDICGYMKGSSGNTGGFEVGYEELVPKGHIKKSHIEENRWKIEFIDEQKEEYKSTCIEWYVDNKLISETSTTLIFEGESTLTYSIMCVFKNKYGVCSDSVRID